MINICSLLIAKYIEQDDPMEILKKRWRNTNSLWHWMVVFTNIRTSHQKLAGLHRITSFQHVWPKKDFQIKWTPAPVPSESSNAKTFEGEWKLNATSETLHPPHKQNIEEKGN
jgi:hypothetical protein